MYILCTMLLKPSIAIAIPRGGPPQGPSGGDLGTADHSQGSLHYIHIYIYICTYMYIFTYLFLEILIEYNVYDIYHKTYFVLLGDDYCK